MSFTLILLPFITTHSCRTELQSIEEGIEIVCELVEEVCEVSFSIVYSHYLEEQAFPHSVDDAKDSLLKIIEVHARGHTVFSLEYTIK